MNNNNLYEEYAKQEQLLGHAEYFRSLEDSKKFILVNRVRRTKMTVAKHIPEKYLGKGWQYRVKDVDIVYRPDVPNVLISNPDTGRLAINSYEPPKHLERVYWDNLSQNHNKRPLNMTDWREIPDCYLELFSFMFDNDLESIKYFMDWLATAIQVKDGRNLTALVLISTPGVGKGVLFEHVITPLFGAANAGIISGENAFVNQFNGTFADKQIVLLDEADLTGTGALNRFKTLVNDKLEVEKKGQEKYNTKNWLNIVIASNNLNAIFIEEGDRRFSVVNMNSRKMLGDMFEDVNQLTKQLSSEDNIERLYKYLAQHQPTRDMNRPFKSARLDEIKDAGLREWERFTLEFITDSMNNGILVRTLKELKEAANIAGMNRFPGRVKIKALSDRFNKVFKLRRIPSKNNEICLEALGRYDTSAFDKIEAVDESKLPLITKGVYTNKETNLIKIGRKD